jgi:protein TonB
MSGAEQPPRLIVATAVSALLHAAVIALVIHGMALRGEFVMALSEIGPKAEPIPVRLVSRPGGGGGGALPGLPSPPAGPPDLPAVAHEPPTPIRRAAATPTPVAVQKPPPVPARPDERTMAALRTLAAPQPAPDRVARPASREPPAAPARHGGETTGRTGAAVASLGTGGGGGTGDGSGGDGSDALARPAYGTNPKPPYPLAARRLGVQGVVTLEVLVRADGTPAEVRIRSSSGSPLLDDSAVETVRSKWRFTPARRGATPIESRVTFPIRFSLDAS